MSEISSSLQSSMQSFSTHTFLPYLTKQQQDIQHAQQEFGDATDAFEGEVAAAHAEASRLSSLQVQQQQELVVEEARLAELDQHVSTLAVTATQTLPQQVQNLAESNAVRAASNRALEKDVATLTSIHTREVDAVTRGVATFRDRLGVAFSVLDGKLQIAYTFISRAEPSKPYTIAIFVDENREYQLHACAPHVDGMQALIDELNRTNNFARFIGQARKQFVQIEAAANEQTLKSQQ